MAVELNNVTSTNANSSSLTFAHDANGGDILLVYVGTKGSTYPYVDTITFNGSENLVQASGAIFGSTQVGEMWYLENPSQVSANVVVTTFNSQKTTAGAVTYTNVSGINTNNITVTSQQDTAPSVTITTEHDDSAIVLAYSQRDASHTPTMDAAWTNRYIEETPGNPTGGQTEGRGLDQGTVSGLSIGTYDFVGSIGATEAWVLVTAELVPSAGDVTPPRCQAFIF
jgi:hypothetical protein